MTDLRGIYERAHKRAVLIDERHHRMGFQPLSGMDLTWADRKHEIEKRVQSAFLGDRPNVGELEAVMAHLAATIAAVEQAEVVRVDTGRAA